MSNPSNRPEKVFTARERGVCIEAAIWCNEHQGQDGKTYKRYSITFRKQYFDRDTRTWQESVTFFSADLPLLQMVAGKAHEYIVLQEQSTDQPAECQNA